MGYILHFQKYVGTVPETEISGTTIRSGISGALAEDRPSIHFATDMIAEHFELNFFGATEVWKTHTSLPLADFLLPVSVVTPTLPLVLHSSYFILFIKQT